MNKERLYQLADFLDRLTPEVFYFGSVVSYDYKFSGDDLCDALKLNVETGHKCGAAACAIGYAPFAHPNIAGLGYRMGAINYLGETDYASIGSILYDIEYSYSKALFTHLANTWNTENWTLHETPTMVATPEQVATSIRNFIDYMENTKKA